MTGPHVPHPGGHVNHRGERICERCGSLESARIHDVPARTDDDRELTERMIPDN